jgi:branched-chain amino acid aminotransferase
MRTVSTPTYDEASNPALLWRNGSLVAWADATVHVNAVGHASVAGVFEGIKAYLSRDGRTINLFRAHDHIARFVQSSRMARLAVDYDAKTLVEAVLTLLAANKCAGDTYIRPWCFARGTVRQMMVPENHPTEVVIDSWGFKSSLGADRGCRAIVSSWRRIDDQAMPPRIKGFSNYHNGRLALLEAKRLGADTAIMLSQGGKVAEGPASCIAIVRNGRLVTPPVTDSILESITRDTMLTLAREQLGLSVEERTIDRSELYVAEEIFFMGTAWELLPVVEVDGIRVGDGGMGAVAKRLDAAYEVIVRGSADAPAGWLLALG